MTGDTHLNPTSGLYEFNGRIESYYSSKVLYHYKTEEWILDEEGMYHDKDGYYIIASDTDPKGTILRISKGLAKVYDTGVGYDERLDLYCNW